MSLYYEDDHVRLYHGKCEELLYQWASADVLVSDVPYGINYNSGARRHTLAKSIAGDKDTAARDFAIAAFRSSHLLQDEAPALIFGTWRVSRPSGTRQVLIWDTKGALGMGDLSIPWKPAHQEIYVLGKGFSGRRSNDVLSFAPVQSTNRGGRLHPHQKPTTLMTDLITKCPEGVVADPFSGSGSTLVAAKALGRKAIGVELDERYCEIAAKRLAQDAFDFGALT
ncbi:site-specific DNA-methyltransferase [Arthrobacter woluwensis]|uniref:DNA-methyltransferase n=1 Tax=Arthrobacter woluwensis TaxID=156980 RepID=UPI000D118624|nr:site-specific DNA-methyltransferase [Arthrobacter woluwensis]PSS43611.1 site-specific DNA-methyltransferase [Arthrobacter woluwensis]